MGGVNTKIPFLDTDEKFFELLSPKMILLMISQNVDLFI